MLFLPGQRHFVEGLQFLLGEINLDSLVAVFNLLPDNECRCPLIVVYAVNEGGVDKSFQVCQMLVDHLCHVTMFLQVVDVARHKRTVNVCPLERVLLPYFFGVKSLNDGVHSYSQSSTLVLQLDNRECA